MKKYTKIIPALIVGIAGITFSPVSAVHLDDCKKKQIEYSEKKKNNNGFEQMDKPREDYSDLAIRWEDAQNEYKYYREKYMKNMERNKELNELLSKRDRYLNLIEEYSEKI